MEDDSRWFCFHNLRHSLASFLVRIRTDPKAVQTLFRHSDVKLTLQFYRHTGNRPTVALKLSPKPVPHPSHGQDMGRIGGILLEFLTQS